MNEHTQDRKDGDQRDLAVLINGPSGYRYVQKGRSLLGIASTVFVVLLSVLFLLTRDPVFSVLGVFLGLLAISAVYAFLKGETWSLQIEGTSLSWSYDRWPRSQGSIDLRTVREIVVDDCSGTLLLTLTDDSHRKVKLIGYGTAIHEHLMRNFPSITLKFIAGT